MDLHEAKELMESVKAFEEWDASRYPYEKAEAAERLATDVRSYIESEAELGGWFTELMREIGESDQTIGEDDSREPLTQPSAREPAIADFSAGKFRVHLVLPGENYGRGNALTYERSEADQHGKGLPLVEFYDTSQDPAKFPGGQFVTRYHMSTLLGFDRFESKSIGQMQALALDGGVPAWTVQGRDLQAIARYLDNAFRSLKGFPAASEPSRVSLKGEADASRDASRALSASGSRDSRAQDAR